MGVVRPPSSLGKSAAVVTNEVSACPPPPTFFTRRAQPLALRLGRGPAHPPSPHLRISPHSPLQAGGSSSWLDLSSVREWPLGECLVHWWHPLSRTDRRCRRRRSSCRRDGIGSEGRAEVLLTCRAVRHLGTAAAFWERRSTRGRVARTSLPNQRSGRGQGRRRCRAPKASAPRDGGIGLQPIHD